MLSGFDDDVAAMDATVDIEPVDAATELRARTDGRPSYNLINGELCWRTRGHVRHSPAGTGSYPVHLQHACGAP